MLVESAKQSGDRAYLGRKPSFTREEFVVRQQTVGIALIDRQTIYRIKNDPAGGEAALAAWGM